MPKIRELNLEENCFYHIFNRGINSCETFSEDENYIFFLSKLKKYIVPYFEIYGYCLMPNHFHLLLKANRISKKQFQFSSGLHSDRNFHSKQIGKLISSYTQAYNKKYSRHGQLFESPFKRLMISDVDYLRRLMIYIHNNPKSIGFNFHNYKYSSYNAIIGDKPTLINKESLNWFDSIDNLIYSHNADVEINWFE